MELKRLYFLLAIVPPIFWGISITGAKIISVSGFSPVEITFGRFLLASILFLPYLIYKGRGNPRYFPSSRRQWRNIFALSLTGVALNNLIFYTGLSFTDAGIASILVSFNPLATMLFAVLLLGEKFTARKLYSLILGIVGVIFIIGFQINLGSVFGNLLILTAAFVWGSSFSFSKLSTESGLSSIAVTGWSEILGTILLIPFAAPSFSNKIGHLTTEPLLWFIFIGVFSSVIGYVLYYRAIQHFGAGKVAPVINIIPVSGAITAFLVLGNPFSGQPIIGFILVMIGVILAQTEKEEPGELHLESEEIPVA